MVRGKLTRKLGIIKGTHNDYAQLEIDGKVYNFFINNGEDKEKIKELKGGDIIEYTTKESKGFVLLSEIKKVDIETKEFNSPNWKEINQEKTNKIVKQVCLKIASEHFKDVSKTTPKDILKFAVALYNQIKEAEFL